MRVPIAPLWTIKYPNLSLCSYRGLPFQSSFWISEDRIKTDDLTNGSKVSELRPKTSLKRGLREEGWKYGGLCKAMIFALCVKCIPGSCPMVIKFKVFKWVQPLVGLFLLNGGNASIVQMLNLPCLILIRNTRTYRVSQKICLKFDYLL